MFAVHNDYRRGKLVHSHNASELYISSLFLVFIPYPFLSFAPSSEWNRNIHLFLTIITCVIVSQHIFLLIHLVICIFFMIFSLSSIGTTLFSFQDNAKTNHLPRHFWKVCLIVKHLSLFYVDYYMVNVSLMKFPCDQISHCKFWSHPKRQRIDISWLKFYYICLGCKSSTKNNILNLWRSFG